MTILFIFLTIINLVIYEFADAKLVKSNSICGEKFVTLTDFNPMQCDSTKNEYFVESVDESCIPGCVYMPGKKKKSIITYTLR